MVNIDRWSFVLFLVAVLVGTIVVWGCLGLTSLKQEREERSEQQKQERIKDSKNFLDVNDNKVNIVFVYPHIVTHKHRSRVDGEYMIVEGVKNSERRKVTYKSPYPAPGEVWILEAATDGYLEIKERVKRD